jgi:hypothetical protein
MGSKEQGNGLLGGWDIGPVLENENQFDTRFKRRPRIGIGSGGQMTFLDARRKELERAYQIANAKKD